MKKLLLSLFLAFTGMVNSQTVIQFDNMETSSTTYLAAGWFIPAATAGWFNNASVSPTLSAVLYGAGNGTSTIEQDWYVLPNVTGLNPARQYQLKFRLASYTFTGPTAATRGLDAADLLEVQVSTNGGTTYITELRIAGNSNAQWPYTSTGTITHTANGSFTNSLAPTGDVYQAPAGVTTTGPSTVTLNLPLNISQVAIDIFCRANSTAEEWWLDNIQLIEIVPLPVELTLFEGFFTEQGNVIKWQTASEHNSLHYLLERSTTGEFDENNTIQIVQAAGNSTEIIDYIHLDKGYSQTINYYRLVQVDTDGKFEIYGPISINNTESVKKIVKIVNALGQEVNETATGVLYEVYEDGTSKKIIR
jgi:hypothetical protein